MIPIPLKIFEMPILLQVFLTWRAIYLLTFDLSKDLDEKVDNVTKLGNNMYFYTGPGGQDSPPPLTSDDEVGTFWFVMLCNM